MGALSGAVGHLRRQRPRARGAPCSERLGPARARTSPPRWWRATATPSCCRRSRWPAPASSASPPRCATSSAPRCARSRSRSGRAEGLVGHAPQAQPDRQRAASPGSRGCCAATPRPGLEDVALWHERDISHSSVERVALPDATILLDYAQHLAARVVGGMTVHADRMLANLDATHGALYSQRALLALVESGRSRDDAYRLVQENAQRAWRRGRPLPRAAGRGSAGARPRRDLRPRAPSCATPRRSWRGWTASRAEVQRAGRSPQGGGGLRRRHPGEPASRRTPRHAAARRSDRGGRAGAGQRRERRHPGPAEVEVAGQAAAKSCAPARKAKKLTRRQRAAARRKAAARKRAAARRLAPCLHASAPRPGAAPHPAAGRPVARPHVARPRRGGGPRPAASARAAGRPAPRASRRGRPGSPRRPSRLHRRRPAPRRRRPWRGTCP